MENKNLRHGFVEIEIDKARKFLDLSPDEKVFLKFDYNALGDADREMKQVGSSTLLIFANPQAVTTDDVRILLGAGLRHQFPSITTRKAGEILGSEDYFYVMAKCIEAVSYAMEGWFTGADEQQKLQDMRLKAIKVSSGEIDVGKMEDGAEPVEQGQIKNQ
jgi:hypothetical protein